MVQVSGLPALPWAKWKTPHWFVVLEMVSLHEGKEEGMTLDGGWEKTTFHPTVVVFSVCNAVLASNQFFCLHCCVGIQPIFFVCIAVYGIQPVFLFVLLRWHPTSFLFVLLRWHPTSFFVYIAALVSNQFFCLYCCVGIQPLDSCLQWWHPPWYSEEEGAAVTIHLGVTCKQLSVLATLVIVFQKLFYHL